MSLASLATASAATVTAVVIGLGSCARPTTPRPARQPVGDGRPVDATDRWSDRTDQARRPAPRDDRPPPRVLRRSEHGNGCGCTASSTTCRPATARPRRRSPPPINGMLAGRSLDPDYSSPWPTGASVRSVQFSGDTSTVDLAGAARQQRGAEPRRWPCSNWSIRRPLPRTGRAVGSGEGAAALRRAAGHRSMGTSNVAGMLTRAAAANTVASVWLISPQEGATVGRTFTAEIRGQVFEATVQLHVRNAAGAVVQSTR